MTLQPYRNVCSNSLPGLGLVICLLVIPSEASRGQSIVTDGDIVGDGTSLQALKDAQCDHLEMHHPGAALPFFCAGGNNCDTQEIDLEMFWQGCAAGTSFTCREEAGGGGQTRVFLQTPAIGPVTTEGHLVTTSDDFGGGWPVSQTDGIAAHYTLSESATGYVMARVQAWKPASEGGSEIGQPASGAKLPVLQEGWHITMNWRFRPAQSTRVIVTNPVNGRSVIAAGGYDTGPASNSVIGGVTEEIHDYLGTGHLSELEIGFALDQNLPFGPIVCL